MYDGINDKPEKRLKKFVWISVIILFVFIFLILPLFIVMRIDADFSMMRTGELRWTLPKEFVQGNTEFVRVNLKYDIDQAEWGDVNDEREDVLEFSDTVKTAEIISLRLISSKKDGDLQFKIEPGDYQEQVIDTIGENYWEWEVTPILSGDAKLSIQQIIKIPTSEGLKDKQVPLKSKSVHIQKRFSYLFKSFFRNNWGWLMSAIIILVWIYFYNGLKKIVKKKREIQNKLKKELTTVNKESIRYLKDGVQSYIRKDKIMLAIENVIEFSKSHNADELNNQISLISARFEGNEKEYQLNTISNSEYGINKSRITKGLLQLITEINEYGTQ